MYPSRLLAGTHRYPVRSARAVTAIGAFGAPREGQRVHAGIDLVAVEGEPIVAMAWGIVSAFPSGYVGLDAVTIEHASETIVYAEFKREPSLALGARVRPGTVLGRAARSSLGTIELHVERWSNGLIPVAFVPWHRGDAAPRGLLDPTPLVEASA